MNQHALYNDAESLIKALIAELGEDTEREGLVETPARVFKSLSFLTSGYNMKPEDVLKTFEDGAQNYDEMVFQGNIPIVSLCEHHMLPFFGIAHIAYIPNGKIVGLSKLSRLTEIFARRLQVQERLAVQIADALMKHLHPIGVGVVLRCRHLCMEIRGVQKIGTITTTCVLKGALKTQPDCRAEFMSMVSDENHNTSLV